MSTASYWRSLEMTTFDRTHQKSILTVGSNYGSILNRFKTFEKYHVSCIKALWRSLEITLFVTSYVMSH